MTSQNLKPFTKGDVRINRKGRPKSFDQLRELAQQIAHEVDPDAKAEKVTVVENMLRKWASGENPQLQQAFMAYAFGKVPESHDLTSGGQPIQPIRYIEVVRPDEAKDQE